MPEIVNVLTVDVEEFYHGVDFDTVLGPDSAARLPSRVVAQTERLRDQLEARGARGTCFTLGLVFNDDDRSGVPTFEADGEARWKRLMPRPLGARVA